MIKSKYGGINLPKKSNSWGRQSKLCQHVPIATPTASHMVVFTNFTDIKIFRNYLHKYYLYIYLPSGKTRQIRYLHLFSMKTLCELWYVVGSEKTGQIIIKIINELLFQQVCSRSPWPNCTENLVNLTSFFRNNNDFWQNYLCIIMPLPRYAILEKIEEFQ